MRGNAVVKWLFAGLVMLTVGNTNTRADETGVEILDRVRDTYDDIEDAEIRFTSKVTFERTQIEQSAAGELLLKKGYRYRLEMGDQTVVTDGETVWSYSRVTDQVIMDLFYTDERTLTPEKILTGGPDEFTVTSLGEEQVDGRLLAVLKLVPRDENSFVTSLRIWVDRSSWLVRQAELVEFNGKKTEYRIQELRINVGLEDSLFRFEIPAGAEVVDFR